jgi:hypothetical protein
VRVAERGVVDDRVEVDERVVAGGVLVSGGGFLRVVDRVDPWVPAFGRLASRVRAHALVVVAPGQPRCRQLVGDRRHVGRIYAAGALRLAVAADHPRLEVVVELAVGLVLRTWRLTADHRDVVVVALVPDRVVVREIGALRAQRGREVGRRRPCSERRRRRLVLEHDHEHVADRGHRRARRPGAGRRGARRRGAGQGRDRDREREHPRCDRER